MDLQVIESCAQHNEKHESARVDAMRMQERDELKQSSLPVLSPRRRSSPAAQRSDAITRKTGVGDARRCAHSVAVPSSV